MDPVTLILSALATGAAKAAGDAAPDAYKALRELIKRKFASKPQAEMVLEEHEKDPETYEVPLKKKLVEVEADKDEEILKKAQELLDKIKEQPGGQEIINQTQTNTASGNTVSGNFSFAPIQEGKKS